MINILKKIISEKSNAVKYINEFQNNIWNSLNYSDNEEVNEILKTLAYDLDYFEENEEFRLEYSIYYGYDKLVDEIELAIAKIERIEKKYTLNILFLIMFSEISGMNRIINYMKCIIAP